ncbi:hypothetical protein TeGR_g8011, partial [Tetraparma gracilis]
ELYSKEDDLIYRGRIGKEDEIEDSDGEEEGTKRGDVVSKKEHDEIVAAKDRAMEELRRKMSGATSSAEEEGTKRGDVVSKKEHDEIVAAKDRAMEELRRKMSGVMSSVEAAVKERAGEHERVREELAAKAAEAGRWGEALGELGVGSPGELRELARAHRRAVGELEERKAREEA